VADLTCEEPNEKGYISKFLNIGRVYVFNVYDKDHNLVFNKSRSNTNGRAESLYDEVCEKYGKPTRYKSKAHK